MEGLIVLLDWAFMVLVYALPVVIVAALMHHVPRENWTQVGMIAVLTGIAIAIWTVAGFAPFRFVYWLGIGLAVCAAVGMIFRWLVVAILPAGPGRVVKAMSASASFGALILIIMAVTVITADLIAPFGEGEVVGDVWQEPGTACVSGEGDTRIEGTCILGTDNIGRDMMSRLIFGAQTTIAVALAAGLASFAIGMFLSFTAAVVGGWIDQVLSRLNDLMLAIPTLVSALVVLAALPQNIFVLVAVMAVIDQTRVYRLGRAVAMDVVVQDYVEAARLRGEGWRWIIFREILPNVWTPLIAEFGLRFAFAVLFLSTLSFLGLGIQPPAADWGGMVKDNKDGIIFLIPAALFPGAAIAILAVCVNLVVDWLLNRTSSLKGGRG